ncbi:VIT domain-containing protein [Desulfobacterales bacterium HSG16]|nr:VIT domain-containing protein [Desulfobacterales bacterium HSG16]
MRLRHIPAILILTMLTLFAAFCSIAVADGMIIVKHHPQIRPYPVPRPPPINRPFPFAPLAIVYHKVDIKIKGQVAVTQVDQVFHNSNLTQMEGTYLFPIPRNAQIDEFSMDINGRQVTAELLDADKARRIYEDIVRRMEDPALLEYAGQGAFKVRIFPIEPNSDKRIKLRYTEVMKSDTGLIEYVYPLNTEKFSSLPIRTVSLQASIESKRPIKSVYSPSHKVDLSRKGDYRATVSFEQNDVRPDTDFALYYSVEPEKGRNISLDLMAYNEKDGEDGYFLLLASPGLMAEKKEVVFKDIIFVLDTSGSMLGPKLKQAKKALAYCITNLNKKDRFEVIRFSTEAQAMFGGLVDASKSKRKHAIKKIDQFKPRGGTAIEDALVKAVKSAREHSVSARPCYVIFLTDGKPTIGNIKNAEIIDSLSRVVTKRFVRVFCFGIGVDINAHLLDNITQKTKGSSQYVLPEEDIEVKVSRFFERIDNPVLTNISLKITGGVRAGRIYPSVLPDIFKGDQLVLLGRYSGTGDGALVLNGMFNNRQVEIADETIFPKPGSALAHDFIPRLWATRRTGYLLDQIRLNGEAKELVDEAVWLARRYGIVTPYTSYLIMEDEVIRTANQQGRPLLPRTSPAKAEPARRELKKKFDSFKKDRSGYSGVGSAKAANALKNAESPESAMFEADMASQIGEKGKKQKKQDGQITRFIRGRAFYWNGEEWMDAKAAETSKNDVKKIVFGTDNYFELIKKHPDAGAWLSVGRKVQVKIGTHVYSIR